jgi:hypothetical protein
MNRYLVVINGRASASMKSMQQVEMHLARSGKGASDAYVYELTAKAIRNQWVVTPAKQDCPKSPCGRRSRSDVGRVKIRWSAREDRTCIRMREAGCSVSQIAKKLNRTPRAIYNRVSIYLSCC